MGKWAREFDDMNIVEIPERVNLGSSWKPIKREKKLSKKDAILLLKGGCTPQEICESFQGFTKGQLAAFKAHITMGTYNKNH